jgi:hypothetical protein
MEFRSRIIRKMIFGVESVLGVIIDVTSESNGAVVSVSSSDSSSTILFSYKDLIVNLKITPHIVNQTD